jgi:hypothetical protein
VTGSADWSLDILSLKKFRKAEARDAEELAVGNVSRGARDSSVLSVLQSLRGLVACSVIRLR